MPIFQARVDLQAGGTSSLRLFANAATPWQVGARRRVTAYAVLLLDDAASLAYTVYTSDPAQAPWQVFLSC